MNIDVINCKLFGLQKLLYRRGHFLFNELRNIARHHHMEPTIHEVPTHDVQ